MIPLTIQQLKNYLEQKGAAVQHQRETDQLVMMMKFGTKEAPLFFRIYEGNELLQMLAFIPVNPKPETVADTARLLHLLNKEIDVPGFGMDESANVVFYRCMLPIKDQKIDTKLFDAYFNSIESACKSFAGVIAAVALGNATFHEVVEKAKERP